MEKKTSPEGRTHDFTRFRKAFYPLYHRDRYQLNIALKNIYFCKELLQTVNGKLSAQPRKMDSTKGQY